MKVRSFPPLSPPRSLLSRTCKYPGVSGVFLYGLGIVGMGGWPDLVMGKILFPYVSPEEKFNLDGHHWHRMGSVPEPQEKPFRMVALFNAEQFPLIPDKEFVSPKFNLAKRRAVRDLLGRFSGVKKIHVQFMERVSNSTLSCESSRVINRKGRFVTAFSLSD